MAASTFPAGSRGQAPAVGPSSSAAAVAQWITAEGKSGPAFLTWYAGAHKNDPSLTPYQGAQIWLIGSSLASALGRSAEASATATGQAAKGTAIGAANVAKAGASWSLVFGNVAGLLTRLLKVGFGAVLIMAGIVQLSGTDKTLKDVLPLIGGPAGKVLAA